MKTSITPANRRILLIDDNESIHQDFRKILNPAAPGKAALVSAAAELFGVDPATRPVAPPFEIDSAFQGQEGLEKVRQACEEQLPYAMAFVDVRMPPGWDGIETIRRIWAEYPDLQVVICTAYSDYSLDEIVDKLERSDQLLILKKPFDAIEVLQLADALTEKWRLCQESRAKLSLLERLVEERTRELREEQRQLVEARKMELVGKLAGGIAQDFNSILTAIIGHADLIRQVAPEDALPFQSAVEIGKSATCAAKLTHQLLAFSRKQMLKPERLDVNLAVRGLEGATREALGESVELSIETIAREPWVRADASQLQEVLITLAHNAHDAMPHGGKLTIETADVVLDPTGDPELRPGRYVMIALTDTGWGIPDEVKAHLFEPYFTTKALGQGKGLGLAMCHGILKQSGGHITVESQMGHGATFKVYLPCCKEGRPEGPAPAHPAHAALPRQQGAEAILLVEENPALRGAAAKVLENQGYTLHRAAGPREAMSIAGRLDRVDLLIADAAMPGMTGRELADWLCSFQPWMKVLLTTSFEEGNTGSQGADPGAGFVRKPYTPGTLSRKARAALDGEMFLTSDASGAMSAEA